ncbi:MAG TPA: hypothetical protein VJH23_05760 [archaeon]|nr:hypothetical protein [archaeon]
MKKKVGLRGKIVALGLGAALLGSAAKTGIDIRRLNANAKQATARIEQMESIRGDKASVRRFRQTIEAQYGLEKNADNEPQLMKMAEEKVWDHIGRRLLLGPNFNEFNTPSNITISIAYAQQHLGITPKQMHDALKRLESQGKITLKENWQGTRDLGDRYITINMDRDSLRKWREGLIGQGK